MPSRCELCTGSTSAGRLRPAIFSLIFEMERTDATYPIAISHNLRIVSDKYTDDMHLPRPVLPWTSLYVDPEGKPCKIFTASSKELGMYQVPLEVCIWPIALDLEQAPLHFLISSMSGVSSLANDLKASRIGLYPVHRHMLPSITFSISLTVVFLPAFCVSKL